MKSSLRAADKRSTLKTEVLPARYVASTTGYECSLAQVAHRETAVAANGKQPIEVRPAGNGWKVRRGESERWYATRFEAEFAAREAARSEHAEFVLKDDRGGVRAISTYGAERHDPRVGDR
jgi:hypothetical protein